MSDLDNDFVGSRFGDLANSTGLCLDSTWAVKGFTSLCLTWAALADGGLVTASLWIPPEV